MEPIVQRRHIIGMYALMVIMLGMLTCTMVHRTVSNKTTEHSNNATVQPFFYPTIIEFLPNGEVGIAQGRLRMTYTLKQFYQIQDFLWKCLGDNGCDISETNDLLCPYIAERYSMQLCMADDKQVMFARTGPLYLSREDLLQIYDLGN
jgi:hypothetical protein